MLRVIILLGMLLGLLSVLNLVPFIVYKEQKIAYFVALFTIYISYKSLWRILKKRT